MPEKAFASRSGFFRWPHAALTGLVLGIACSGAPPAQAFVVTVNGTAYDVQKQFMSYTSHTGLMTSQPWWGSESLATIFSDSVAYNLGTISAFNYTSGPIFAYEINASSHPLAGISHGFQYGDRTQSFLNETLQFAVASPLPAPAPAPAPLPVLGSIAAYRFSRRLRAKVKHARA